MAEISGITDGRAGRRAATPGKLNVKTGPPLAEILVFSSLLVFNRLFFCIFWGVFVFVAGIDTHNIQIHYYFLTFFECLS